MGFIKRVESLNDAQPKIKHKNTKMKLKVNLEMSACRLHVLTQRHAIDSNVTKI